MPNFTPGKWVKHGDFIIGNTVCLAQVLSVHEHEDDAERNRIEKTANARLIAAAPEMYEALERSLHMLNCYDPNNSVVGVIRELLARIDLPANVET